MRTLFALSRGVYTGSMTTRRDRVRASTIDEIKEAALSQIAAEGATALSIRGVARAIEMSPAGLYRYYDGLDALVTDLLTDAYEDLADAVAHGIASIDGPASERYVAGAAAYRQWALDHPNRFLLIFGTPIPGYAAPQEGPTVQANRRMGEAFFRICIEGWLAGEITAPPLSRPVTEPERSFAAEIPVPGFPPELVPALLGTWAHLHGLVTLEILDQLHWMYPGVDADAFFEGETRRMVEGLSR
jgi:AcrR family transcriptional regulator